MAQKKKKAPPQPPPTEEQLEFWEANRESAHYVPGKGYAIDGAPGFYDDQGRPIPEALRIRWEPTAKHRRPPGEPPLPSLRGVPSGTPDLWDRCSRFAARDKPSA